MKIILCSKNEAIQSISRDLEMEEYTPEEFKKNYPIEFKCFIKSERDKNFYPGERIYFRPKKNRS